MKPKKLKYYKFKDKSRSWFRSWFWVDSWSGNDYYSLFVSWTWSSSNAKVMSWIKSNVYSRSWR